MPLYRLYIDTTNSAEKDVTFDVDGNILTEKVIVEYPSQRTIGYYVADNEQDLLDNVIGSARNIYSYEEVPTYYKDLASVQPTKPLQSTQQFEQMQSTQELQPIQIDEMVVEKKQVLSSDTAFELSITNVLNKIDRLQPVQVTNQDTSFELPINRLFVSTDFLKSVTVDQRLDIVNNGTKVTLVDDPIIHLDDRMKFIQQEQKEIVFVEKTVEETTQLTEEEQIKYEVPEGATFSDASAMKLVSMFGKI